MKTKTRSKLQSQIQVRIDAKTKEDAKKVLENFGLDISTVINIFFKQMANTGILPIELRDVNGFRPHKAKELKEAILEAKTGKKTFSSVKSFINDLKS